MRTKIYALIVSALAVTLTAPAFALTAFAAPAANDEEEAETTDVAEDEEETEEITEPEPADTKPFDAEEFLESYTTATTYDYYGDPYYDTDGNLSLVSDRHVIYSSDQLQFLSVTTKDGHVFYIIIDYTDKDGDNVYFLNKVDDFDLYRLLYAGKEDENEDRNIVEEYEERQGITAAPTPSANQIQGTRKTETTTTAEPADNPPGGISTELLVYLIGGGVFVLGLVIFLIARVRSIKKNRIPTDDFDEDDDDEDIYAKNEDIEIK